MNINDLKSYCEKYINNFVPFKDEYFFRCFNNVFFNEYLNDLYNNDPYILKQLFQYTEVPYEIRDIILNNIGLPKEFINELNDWEKLQFLDNLSNYNLNKGSINSLTNILKTFTNNISAYELYLDFNLDELNWVFKPKVIYNNPLNDEINYPLPYQEIYNNVPNFILSKEYLDNLINTNNIMLPLKSNLLLLDYGNFNNSFLLNDLKVSSFLKEYSAHTVTIFIDSNFFELSYSFLTHLWFYLITIYFDYEWIKFNKQLLIHFDTTNVNFPMTNEVRDIINEFNQINLDNKDNRNNLDKFIDDYLTNQYSTERETFSNITNEDLRIYLYNSNQQFIIFLDELLANNPKKNIAKIISEFFYILQNHFNNSPNELYKDYGLVWLNYLPKIINDIEETPEYKILNLLKPYHVDIVKNQINGISVDDNLNIFIIGSDAITFIESIYNSSFVISDTYEFE